MLAWLLGSGVGPAVVALPVTWAGDSLAGAAQRWFRRLGRMDDLSRLVKAATSTSVGLTRAEFGAVRHLLEAKETWRLAGRGTMEDLAIRVASCLPPGKRRTAQDSHVAALAIARGLLEFAVADLDPKLFQMLLLARLQRLETNQASALDDALFGLHADLAARLAAQGGLDAQRFTSVMDHLKRLLDGLPPGPASRGEIVVYLQTLIDWLSSDPWPQYRRLGGPVLTHAAIERRLAIAVTGGTSTRDHDADDLARSCQRLVILGGPGSGKTWLAKRTARRCAQVALDALAAGEALNEVELPLYTACSHLSTAVGGIRDATVSCALNQLADLGGSRISAALRSFFTERNAPTVLVIDALDEAHGPGERLRQADTLPSPWRIILTSRPSSWDHQLFIETGNDSHRVGELRPLRYPADVAAFINGWFARRPDRGRGLIAQIARRPGLQQAATVPLILAFYCIIGGDTPLPDFRSDLYAKVIRRLLIGQWRQDDDRQPDLDGCLQILRDWAWAGATIDDRSGIGTWADNITTDSSRLAKADQDALDHVATSLGPPEVDTGTTVRRFIHRSVREHLVAEYLASLPVDQAAEELLPHLWYDPDWEYTAPTAIVMHPQHDQLLRSLICRAARSDQIPDDLSVIDAGWEFRRLLARLAAESSEASWSPVIAGLISGARVDLARSGATEGLGAAVHWGTSNHQARKALLMLLADEAGNWTVAEQLASGLVQLGLTSRDKRQACEILLGLLTRQASTQQVTTQWAERLVSRDLRNEDVAVR
jgi:hypothetical protein